jgi:hypothetical protein
VPARRSAAAWSIRERINTGNGAVAVLEAVVEALVRRMVDRSTSRDGSRRARSQVPGAGRPLAGAELTEPIPDPATTDALLG